MDYNVFQNNNTLKNVNKNYKWELYKLTDILEDDTKNAKKIKKEQYLKEGKYPIIDQGQSEIAGYTNDKEGIYKQEYPFLIFGDHTRSIKYIDDSIFIGADGVKLLKPRLDIKKFNVRYVYYFLKTVQLPSDGYSRHFKYLKQVVIALPLLEQQNKIVEVLDKSQKLINKRKAQIEALDELVKSRFIEMFGDPVSNPLGWSINELSQIGTLGRGVSKHRPRNAPELLGGNYPLIQTGDVANSGLYIKKYNATYSELGLKQSKMWEKGTLCITIAANIAKTGILEFDACFPDSVVGFIAGDKTNNIFIYYWFSFFQKLLEAQAPESAQKNINLKILNELRVIQPPIELQNQFASFVKQVDKLKFEMQESLKELEDNFNSLMQRAFKGELFS